jgi:hypothetical protein
MTRRTTCEPTTQLGEGPLTFDDKNRSEVDLVIVQVKQELRSLFVKSKDQIKKVGNALKKVVKKEESICEEIKIALKEEIAESVISTRTIELHCPPEWKRKTKPKNEKISFSKQAEEKPQQLQIAPMQDGQSVIMNDTSSKTGGYVIPSEGVNELHDKSKQNGTGTNDNDEERTMDDDAKEEPVITHSLTGEIGPVNKESGDLIDRRENFVSHVPMSFENLRKDMDTLSQKTKRAGNLFFKVSVKLRTHMVEIEFYGNTKRKNRMMISTGKGVLEEAN